MSERAERYDVCVVGAGVMGLATARGLAGMGKSVVLCEQYEIGHELGSSTGPARAFAVPHNQTHLIELALETVPLWRELEAESGRRLFSGTGAMLRSRKPEQVIDSLEQAGAGYEVLTPHEVNMRFGFSLPGELACIWSALGGTLWAEQVLAALRASAESRGVEIRERSKVIGVDEGADKVVVTTGAATIEAAEVVVTTGPWSSALLRDIGVDVPAQASRQTVVYVPMANTADIPGLYEEGEPSVYWVASADNELRVGAHVDGDPAADPEVKGEPDMRVVELIEKHLARRFPARAIKISRSDTCFYTKTTNEEFILQKHGHVTVGIACNGRGFKFAPYIGNRLADIVVNG